MAARILVVDDSPTVRRVVASALKRAGLDVVVARDGADAVAQTATSVFDLLVVDFVMPGLNGLQVLGRVSERLKTPLPAVLMCTRTDPLPAVGLEQLGVRDTITKPFSPDAIIAVIEHALERLQKDNLGGLDDDDDATVPMRPDAILARAAADQAEQADLSRALAGALHARGVAGADGLAQRLATAVAGDEELRAALARAFDDPRPLPVLYGDLEAVALPEVLQLIKQQGQTGVLEVVLREARYEACFREGRVVSVRARDPQAEQRLGRYFVRQGSITAEELQTFLRESDPSLALGQRLRDAGRLSEEQLYEALRDQAVDLLYEMLRAASGFFAMRRGDDMLPNATGVGLSVDEVLFASLRRVDEWRVIEREVPSFDAVFRIVGEAARIDGLGEDEERALKLVAAKPRSPLGLVDETGLKAFDACKLLYRLVILQRIERVGGEA